MQCDVKKFEPGYWRLLVPTYVLCTGYVPYDKKTAGYQKIREGKEDTRPSRKHEKSSASNSNSRLRLIALV